MCCPPAASVAVTSEVVGEPALGPDEQHYQAGGGMGGGTEKEESYCWRRNGRRDREGRVLLPCMYIQCV